MNLCVVVRNYVVTGEVPAAALSIIVYAPLKLLSFVFAKHLFICDGWEGEDWEKTMIRSVLRLLINKYDSTVRYV